MREVASTIDRTRLVHASIFTVLALMALILSACNTTAGVGRDIESAGSAIEGAAENSSN